MLKGRDVILGILTEGEKTGYEINEMFQSIFSHFFDGTYGMIYPTLRKLEQEGLIKKEVVEQTGKPNKNVFSITEDGKQSFHQYMISEMSDSTFKSDFLVRLFFGKELSKERVEEMILKEIEINENKLTQLQQDYRQWQHGMSSLQKITYDYGITRYSVILDVLKKYLNEFGMYSSN